MSVLESIGNTPMMEIINLNPKRPKVRILAKYEGCNPGGSIKDRAALYMIRKAEENGALTPDKTIIEPSSGNTGIALAMIGAAKGYRVRIVMPESASIERRQILKAYGAEVILSPAEKGMDGAIELARNITESNPERYYMPNQFDNSANVLAHYETTGPEILRQTDGNIDVFIAGIGTSGTLMGAGRYLKEHRPDITIIGIEPPQGHRIQGLKNLTESMVPSIFNRSSVDRMISIEDREAFSMASELAKREGIFVGLSSGAAVAGALKISEEMEDGTIVTILPDRGDRYLSPGVYTQRD